MKGYTARAASVSSATDKIGPGHGRMVFCPAGEGSTHSFHPEDTFIQSVCVYRRWQQVRQKHSAAALVDFHTRHKFLLHVHNEPLYREMGAITARSGQPGLPQRLVHYQQLLIQAMETEVTVTKHVNVLMHLMGFFKTMLTGNEKRVLLKAINQFRKLQAPLFIPISLLNYYVLKYDNSYLSRQYYLNPHSLE